MRWIASSLSAVAALWVSGATVQADPQAPADSAATGVRKSVRAAHVSGGDLRLDGRLDESAWRQAAFVSDFVQKDPQEGAPPQEATEVAFLYDDEFFWIGA